MSSVIKEEPVEIEESQTETNLGLIDQKYESELAYLKNVSDKIFVDQDLDLENFEIDHISETLINTQNNISISDIVCKISDNNKIENTNRKIKTKDLAQEKFSLEKKLILNSLANSAKSDQNLDSNFSKYELINADEEAYYLSLLNKYLENESINDPALARLRAKLKMRSLKRKNYSKVFDIDSYVNELIDQEKMKMLNLIKQRNLKPDLNENLANGQVVFDNENNDDVDDDVIFESATSLQTSDNSEIIEIKRVLDRFKNKKLKSFHRVTELRVHMVEARREDVKCLISPYSKQILRPFIWKDFRSLPKKLRLHKDIMEKMGKKFDRFSIDYVHLRPEHVIPINAMCREHFWAGIDVSECLEYPDYTIVALYRKLIIGFALLVPNSSLREAYLSFILVHPDWRTSKTALFSYDVSVAKFLIYYLIQKCSECDISLHVSVNSPAVIFYQKFGFQIVEYIKNFYDKYYSDELNLSKDAFLMKYTRN